ncbi:hypothetical protein Patl1_05851 [Pistacia atlantica]|uniref:Uncharacterized protein n=1 Tax=Pistacia atlantica TaxID=434234 RepID=A0ACC1BVI0_9ROSI|nr:hypothetical protein Patl1_05851 [Pistacia atlantica]
MVVVGVTGMDSLSLSEKAARMRESLQKSQTITDNVVSILGSFDHRLSALETAMRPTQIRTHAIRKAHENIDKTLKAAEVILAQFDLSRQAEAKILRGPHEDLESYLAAIDQLRSNISFFSGKKSFKSSEGVVNNANTLLVKAISKLEDEFKQLLASYSKPLEPDRLFECLPNSMRPSSGSPGHHGEAHHKSPSHNHSDNSDLETATFTPPALIPPRILPLLHDLALQMVQAGHQQQLLKIYRDTRSSVLEESLRKLGVERLGKEDVQKMQWEVLEAKIGNWIHYMRIAVKLLFAGERKVCDQIFEGFDSVSDQCFAEVTTSSVLVLLSFGEAIAKSKRSPEKLFVLLDMYEIMRELHSEMLRLMPELPSSLLIELVFKGKACTEIRESAFSLTKRLAQTAQETFGDFEEAVEKDATKTAVLDGTVHPLTSYVINYVKFLFDYQSTLKQLFQEFENSDGTGSQLATVTMRIMQALQTNLDGKSKQYRDPALTHLFLMNNIHYMVRSVRRSEAKDLLGDDWVQRHRRIVQQHANQYKRNAWQKILQCLSVQGLTSSGGGSSVAGDASGNSSGVSRQLVKDRLRTFNIQFEELHQKQSQWTVPDTELRESLRLAVAEVLLPAYRSFVKRFGTLVENGKNPQKYIRYSAEDLERMLGGIEFSRQWKENKKDGKWKENAAPRQNKTKWTAKCQVVCHEAMSFPLQLRSLFPSRRLLLHHALYQQIIPTRNFAMDSRNHSQDSKESTMDETRESCAKEACDYTSVKHASHIIPHLLKLYGSCATARDFEIYAPGASFEDPLMCAQGVPQIKSAFYSLSKVFSESKITEYSVKENVISPQKLEILIDNKQHYKFLGRNIDMISLIKLHVEDGKIVRHEDWWDKKPLRNRETVKLPLVGHILEMTRRASMLATHAMMGFGKDPSS